MTTLPKSWVTRSLGQTFRIVGGGTPSTKDASLWGDDYPWVTSADIYGVREIRPTRSVSRKGVLKSATNVVPRDSLLVVTRVGLGKIAVADSEICFSQDIQALTEKPDYISTAYTLHFLSAELGRLKFQGRGTTISGLTKKQLDEIALPIPPLPEQHRIVARIEELFSELDASVESLTRARALLGLYRQSLLKAAFQGKLTADWRAANPDKLEPPETLLSRIRKDRETRYAKALDDWQSALSDWRNKGEKGRKPQKPQRPEWNDDAGFEELAPLPDGWAYCLFGNIAYSIRNGISEKPSADGDLKIFRISAVRPMAFDLNDFRHLHASEDFDQFRLRMGDLVFTRYNGSRPFVGVAAVYRGDESHVYPDKLIRSDVQSSLLDAGYLEKAVNCGEPRAFIESQIRTTAGQAGISGGDLKVMPVPVCGPAEQSVLNDILDARLSQILAMEAEITAALTRIAALRQSILKRAFSGRLVPQDPNDEPASALLARLQAQPLATPARRKRRA